MRRVVIAGGGQAGFQAAASLRQNGFAGSIALVGDENRLPYQRPPLSKSYLQEGFSFERLTLRPADFFAGNAIDLHLADPASRIDRPAKALELRSGRRLSYDHLVLATGARNRVLPVPGRELPGVHMLRGAADAERLRAAMRGARRLAVIGGGFIGLEVAASARMRGLAVAVLEAGPRLMARVVSPAVSAFFLDAHRAMGTEVLLDQSVRGIAGTDQVEGVETAMGFHAADLVLVAVGVVPNDALAAEAGLETRNGVLVDRFMTTSDPLIFAVGDCAAFTSRHVGGLVRLESVQNAVDQAKCVANRIGGGAQPYDEVPWFWSDQGAFKLQIAGISTGADAVHAARTPDGDRLIAYAFRDGALIGVETINRPGDHMAGRKLLATDFRLAREEAAADGFDLKRHVSQLLSPPTAKRRSG